MKNSIPSCTHTLRDASLLHAFGEVRVLRVCVLFAITEESTGNQVTVLILAYVRIELVRDAHRQMDMLASSEPFLMYMGVQGVCKHLGPQTLAGEGRSGQQKVSNKKLRLRKICINRLMNNIVRWRRISKKWTR